MASIATTLIPRAQESDACHACGAPLTLKRTCSDPKDAGCVFWPRELTDLPAAIPKIGGPAPCPYCYVELGITYCDTSAFHFAHGGEAELEAVRVGGAYEPCRCATCEDDALRAEFERSHPRDPEDVECDCPHDERDRCACEPECPESGVCFGW